MADGKSKALRRILEQREKRSLLRIATAGSVDDGKSTLIGRLLHDSVGIFEDTLDSIKKASRGTSGLELDLALVTDGLRAEREQKITIDVAYRYFSTPKRSFILADTPGHEQYTRNMATGASTADVAIVLIDATKGVLAQTKRHSFILTLLGVKHILVAINKMDRVDYSRHVFEEIRAEYSAFAAKLTVNDLHFIPVSALKGDNVVSASAKMPWYGGGPLLELLENIYVDSDVNQIDFRYPVQYVLRPHQGFRGYCGRVDSGVARLGREVVVVPSMKRTRIKEICSFDGDLEQALPSQSVTLTLEHDLDVSRGDMICYPENIPNVSSELEAMVVWMSDTPLDTAKTYIVQHTTRQARCRVEKIRYKVDVNTLHRADAGSLELNEIGRVRIESHRPLFFDSYQHNRSTGGFILVDVLDNTTVAAGMILDRKTSEQRRGEDVAEARNIRREQGLVTAIERQRRLGQRGTTIWLTGLSGAGKSHLAKNLERRLFVEGRAVYRLDGDNVRFGLSRDLGFTREERTENIRRVAETAQMFNDAGLIVITAFISPLLEQRRLAREIIGDESFVEVFVDTPLEVCEQRDAKGLYAKARRGEILDFTGVSAPYEVPVAPELVVASDEAGLEAMVSVVTSSSVVEAA